MAGQQLFKVTLTPPQSWLGAHFSTDLTAVMMQRSILVCCILKVNQTGCGFLCVGPFPGVDFCVLALLSKLTLTLRNSH